MNIFQRMAEDVRMVQEQDPAAESAFVIWLTYPGLHAVWRHQREHRLWVKGHRGLARWLAQHTRNRTGVEIHPGAQIGRRLFIDHAMGVIIGETAIVGDDCTIYQGVTLGGTGNETGKRHPTIGNHVMIGTGASVLGNITIGDNCKIGGGAVVVKDTPANCTLVGIPAKIIIKDGKRAGKKPAVAATSPEAEIAQLKRDLAALQARLDRLSCVKEPAEFPAPAKATSDVAAGAAAVLADAGSSN